MDKNAIIGCFSIIGMMVILIGLVYYIRQELLTSPLVILIIIAIVGLVNGYIFNESIKKAIIYVVGLGESLIVILFIIFNNSIQSASATTDGLGQIALVFVILFIVVFLVLGFIGFIAFGILIYGPAIVGKSIRNRSK